VTTATTSHQPHSISLAVQRHRSTRISSSSETDRNVKPANDNHHLQCLQYSSSSTVTPAASNNNREITEDKETTESFQGKLMNPCHVTSQVSQSMPHQRHVISANHTSATKSHVNQ
jgi:hypothetical protein